MTRRHRFRYQDQDSPLTLADGLEEYYQGHDALLRPQALSADSAELFRSHDICHVIFGLDTSLTDEVLTDLRTVLGTDVGPRRYLHYLRANRDAQRIFQRIGYWRVAIGTIIALPRLLPALWYALRQPRRWPWHPPDAALRRSLADLRKEYGIWVL